MRFLARLTAVIRKGQTVIFNTNDSCQKELPLSFLTRLATAAGADIKLPFPIRQLSNGCFLHF